MKDFSNKLAVVTGGGSGIGRQLVVQLAAAGCNVATCDLNMENLNETRSLASDSVQVSLHACDVSDESQVLAFAEAVLAEHQTDHINLLFNNAGVAGGGSFITDERAQWDRTFAVCWQGVYNNCRAFMPALVASSEAHLVNVSSVNGFWASLGPQTPNTAYCAAKFAVKGFTEALITDLQMNAPHVGVSVVMPGHIGTSITINTVEIQGMTEPADMSTEELDEVRRRWSVLDKMALQLGDDDVRALLEQQGERFRDDAPTTAEQAASIILDGVREKRWRILVGEDAKALDASVRQDPENAYGLEFFQKLLTSGHFGGAGV